MMPVMKAGFMMAIVFPVDKTAQIVILALCSMRAQLTLRGATSIKFKKFILLFYSFVCVTANTQHGTLTKKLIIGSTVAPIWIAS